MADNLLAAVSSGCLWLGFIHLKEVQCGLTQLLVLNLYVRNDFLTWWAARGVLCVSGNLCDPLPLFQRELCV